MTYALEKGHESGQMQTDDTLPLAASDSGRTPSRVRATVLTVGVAPLGPVGERTAARLEQ